MAESVLGAEVSPRRRSQHPSGTPKRGKERFSGAKTHWGGRLRAEKRPHGALWGAVGRSGRQVPAKFRRQCLSRVSRALRRPPERRSARSGCSAARSADLPSGRRSARPGCGPDAAKSLSPASKMGIGAEIAPKGELSQS